MLSLSEQETQVVLRGIAKLSIDLVAGLCEIQAESDSNNEIREQGSPAVMPVELELLRTSTFIEEVLDPHHMHISQFWDVDEIDQIENDHQELRSAFSTEAGFKEKIAAQDHSTMFNVGWDAFKGRFM